MSIFSGKLILSDLDGTLLQDDGHISWENQQAIRLFIQGGGLFSVATGRSKIGMEHFFPELQMNAPAILYNGSVIHDFSTSEDIWTGPVGANSYELALLLKERFPAAGIEVYAGHQPYVVQDSQRTRLHFQNVKMPWNLCALEEVPQPWLSLVITGEADCLPAIVRLIEQAYPSGFFLQYSSPHMLEIMHPQANKGAAARRLCRLLGISIENFYAVGDGTNDVELLRESGHGCAPADACPQALSVAKHRLPSYQQHAIAALIHQIQEGSLL